MQLSFHTGVYILPRHSQQFMWRRKTTSTTPERITLLVPLHKFGLKYKEYFAIQAFGSYLGPGLGGRLEDDFWNKPASIEFRDTIKACKHVPVKTKAWLDDPAATPAAWGGYTPDFKGCRKDPTDPTKYYVLYQF